jgi:dipeptidyl aminopeptidase/acylaminoacyl peptidase
MRTKSFTAAGALLFCIVARLSVAQPDVALFTDYPEFEDVKISPKGTYLAFTRQAEDRESLTVVRTADLSVVSSRDFGRDTDVQQFDWANDERILLSPGRSFAGQLDYKQPTGEIFGVDADGRNFTVLFGYQAGQAQTGTRVTTREAVYAAGRIIDWLPDDADRVIVQSLGYGVEGELNRAWTMDVRSGRLRSLARSPIRNGNFVTDADHEIRFVYGYNEENVAELYRLNADDKWELIATDEDAQQWLVPLAPYGQDGWALARDRSPTGTWGLSAWNPATMERQSLFHHEEVDISTLYFDNEQRYWAVRSEDHFPSYFYPDESHPFVALHKELRERFGTALDVQILDETDDLDKAVVFVSGPRHPGDFLVLDVSTGEFPLQLARFPDLPAEALSPMEPFELSARDGERIRGYVTVPAGGSSGARPMVVIPHGGPHGVYNNWGYDYETQLFASRGYVVLHVNYRGSGGRGIRFLEAGYGEWGGKMQDDITDATRWAIAEAGVDPARICIFGASYGAYAALTGAYREPDLYRCAIGMSGVYDLNLMFESGDIAGAQRGVSYLREVLGEDRALLDSRSPVANADRIKAKVMLIHGQQDARAPIEHAERMRDALRDEGNEPVWFAETRERHGIMSAENRVRVYTAILAFLDENAGAQGRPPRP